MENVNASLHMPARERPEKFLVAFSYAGEQRILVRAIAEELEKSIGANRVFFDEWFEHSIAGLDGDLELQEIYLDRCELVVICVSGQYGAKLWTTDEFAAIRSRMMRSRLSPDGRERDAILPIRVGDGEVKGLLPNTIVPDARGRSPEATARLIVDRLALVVPDLRIGTGDPVARFSWPEMVTPLLWPVADHSGVREAFERLMDGEASWRLLPICGPSETGKSHITRQMLANALRIPGLACGRFDFKGTTGMDAEVRAFVQELDVSPPPDDRKLNERLGHILDQLKRRKQAALVVLDTYEVAGEAQDWVEKELLPSLIRATWLRVVIAGQRVPDRAGAVWDSAARDPLRLVTPPPADWYDYGKRYRPDLTMADVEVACRLASNKASLLAQLLGS